MHSIIIIVSVFIIFVVISFLLFIITSRPAPLDKSRFTIANNEKMNGCGVNDVNDVSGVSCVSDGYGDDSYNTMIKTNPPKDFLYVITRVRNENVLLKSFVSHYLSQGVDRIYLLDDASTIPYDADILSNPRVVVLKSVQARRRKQQMYDANELYKQLRSKVTWVMNVDVDEFVHSRRNGATIREKLETTFKDVDCVFVPWIMFSFNGQQHEPKDVIKEHVYRWNHDKKHPHPNKDRKNRCRYDGIECKSVFKTSRFESMKDPHHPTEPTFGKTIYYIYVDGSTNEPIGPNFMGSYYSKIREKDIATAHLICNHYRFTSLEKIKEKCRGDSLMKYSKMGDTCVENCVLSDNPEIGDEYLKKNYKKHK